MRYYVLRPGDPPSIRVEFVVEDSEAHAVERSHDVTELREGMCGAVTPAVDMMIPSGGFADGSGAD